VADAGADIDAFLGQTVGLYAGQSYDKDLDTLEYLWEQLSGAPVTLVNEDTAKPTFVPTTIGTLSFRVTVTDPDGASASDDVTVTVRSTSPVMIKVNGSWIAGSLNAKSNGSF
jgi:chitinase